MAARKIIPLEAIRDEDHPAAGGKAAGLSRLVGAGLPVPRGFCITTAAYRDHLVSNGLARRLDSALGRLPASSPEERGAVLRTIREEIAAAPLAESLRLEVVENLEKLRDIPLAVRSSAGAEDLPGHSFAGQHDTFLGVRGPQECLEAVAACWASLWSERAFEYRERNGFDHLGVDMAVIVQALVPAETAGVVFTADPLTASPDHITVEAVTGLGDKLVSGRVNPDRVVLSRRGLEVIATHCGGNGSGEICLGEETARLIGLMAMRAESIFHTPLDVEWAARNGRIFLLQARPITALGNGRSWADRQVWSDINAGEILPDVATPPTWSLVQLIVDKVFTSVFGRMGMDFGDSPVIGEVAGRAYFNLNTMTGALRSFPGLRRLNVGEVLGGGHEIQRLSIPDEDIPDLDFSLLRAAMKTPSFLAWIFSSARVRGEAFLAGLRDDLSKLQELEPASLSDEDLAARLAFICDVLVGSDDIIGIAARGMYFFTVLDEICRRWFDASMDATANQLCSGLEGMESAEAGYELWRLALLARDDPGVLNAILCGEPFAGCREMISSTAVGRDFLARWEAFMRRHGHHTRGEIEVYNARWSEDPDEVLAILRTYLESTDEMDPLARLEKNARARLELTRRCRRSLGDPIRRRLFDYYLRQAQYGLIMRENIKNEAVRCVGFVRLFLLEAGRRLAARGVLADVEDIFFLYLEETEEALHGAIILGLKGKVASRREEYAKNVNIIPPKIIRGHFDPDDFVADTIDEEAEVLTGLGVCPGVVTGPARVMLRSENGQVHPGEIMVAPFTDPGWTPHFLTAAAIVMDMGGLLSHGSIVAREYGIPTVVNVGPATRIIKTGQIIQVDGTKGTVRIIRQT